ncbi:MAG: YbjN domain-containing protein [Sphingomonadales bacterium]|jgi:hypothetical protein
MSHLETDYAAEEAAPIDMLEHVFDTNGWAFERHGNEEITTSVKGGWANYELRALWRDEEQVLQIIARADLAASDARRAAAYEALGLINEQLWMGHFELWSADGSILFRHATLLPLQEGGAGLSIDQAEVLVDAAVDEFERFYPVFQLVLFGDLAPADALAAALIETVGEA